MDWERIVGRNIRQVRLERQLTQEDVAHQVGVVTSYFGEIERGRRNPTIRVLGRIADVLGVPLARLIEAGGE
jgi:transcriptional regulator with XRE-family HTH domain